MPHEWDASSYDRIAHPQARWGGPVVSWLELRGDERVGDAGCGTGRVTEAVLARLPEGWVVAIDGSAAMLAQARRRLAGHTARLSLVRAELNDPLPLRPGCLDAVLSTATFHWLRDHDALFHHLAAVLRPGGQLAAQCGGRGNIASVVAALEQVAPGQGYPWTYATPEETAGRLARAGFVDIDTWLTDEPTRYASRSELASFLETVVLWPQLRRLPAADRAGFVDRVVGELPGLDLDYVRLNIRARLAG
jgi:trans-aconitate 2-methyltransferase